MPRPEKRKPFEPGHLSESDRAAIRKAVAAMPATKNELPSDIAWVADHPALLEHQLRVLAGEISPDTPGKFQPEDLEVPTSNGAPAPRRCASLLAFALSSPQKFNDSLIKQRLVVAKQMEERKARKAEQRANRKGAKAELAARHRESPDELKKLESLLKAWDVGKEEK